MKFRSLLGDYWQPALFWLIGLALVITVLFYKLGSLTPYLSRTETASHSQVTSLTSIVDNPLNTPYKLLAVGIDKLGHNNTFGLRAVSALFGLATVVLFYYVVSRWYDKRTAVLGTLLFATSAWFLHYTRVATPAITSTLLLASLAYGHWIRKTKRSAFVGILGVIIAASLIYIPGLIWFVIGGVIWQRKQIGEHLKEMKLSLPLVAILGVILLAPLAIALSRDPSLLRGLAGLPARTPNPYDYVRHVLNVPFQIFFRGPNNPILWLGRLPLLDVFTSTMFIIGIYTYWKRRKLDRTKILGGLLIGSALLVGLQGSLSIIVLAPTIYLIVAAGISYLTNQWLSVYPRNPLARTVGITLISILVALSCVYSLRQYFIAWSQSPATKKSYQQRL